MLEPIRFEEAPTKHLGRDVRAVLTERVGGTSSGPFAQLNLGRSTADNADVVRANETAVLAALGLPDRVARLRLEHGTRILTVEEPGLHGMADGIMTCRRDLVLWLTVADCYPVALTAGSWRALGHCGWRGVAAGLPEALVSALRQAAGVDSVRAWIGPGIGSCCYQVGPEVSAAFPASAILAPARDGANPRLDLRSDITRRFRQAGLADSEIAISSACTSCAPERFFSHRRDGVPSGRMAALLWVEP